jgi:hypothetical protein
VNHNESFYMITCDNCFSCLNSESSIIQTPGTVRSLRVDTALKALGFIITAEF